MPLTDLVHPAAAALCVVAAGLMALRARGRAVRWAHVVLLVAMALSGFFLHSSAVLVGSAVALTVPSAVLAGRRDRESRACAVDVAACAGLTALMALSHLGAGTHAPAADSATVHARLHAVVPGDADHAWSLVVALLALGGTWVWARRRTGDDAGRPAAPIVLMLLGMGAMIVAPA